MNAQVQTNEVMSIVELTELELLLAAIEEEARLLPAKIQRLRQRADEEAESFLSRKQRMQDELAVLKALERRANRETVKDLLKRLTQLVPGLAEAATVDEVEFAKSQHYQLLLRVIQRTMRQATSIVLFNERRAERAKVRESRFQQFQEEAREGSREADAEAYAGEPAALSWRETLNRQEVADQIEAVEALYGWLAKLHTALGIEVTRVWSDYSPQPLALFSTQRHDGNGEWDDLFTYADAREANERNMARRAEAAKAQSADLANMLAAL